jgi:Cof subfamily protein (haloacid dehalogenase superfamily)
LRNDKNISDYTLSILEKCKKRGIKIGIATARSEKSSERCFNLVKPDITILNGGALAMKCNGEIMYKRLLSTETSDGIIAECIKIDNVGDIAVETEGNYYVSYKNQVYHPDYMHGKYYDFSNPLSKQTYKITAKLFNKETVIEIGKKFKECRVTGYFGDNWCRFTHKEAEKMAAIEAIAKNESVAINEIAAFGDDCNDFEMIKKCGIGVVMGNGTEELKNIAKYIYGNNDEDGVAKWIEENIL